MVLLSTMLGFLVFGKIQWEPGMCKIDGFYNLSYGQTCWDMPESRFDVSVKVGGSLQIMNGWRPKLDRQGETVSLIGAPFRCRNLKGLLRTCDFFDPPTFSFCDDWRHRADNVGQTCPSGFWSCLVK